MTKLFLTALAACFLGTAPAYAAEGKAAEATSPAVSTEGKATEDATLFTRVNGAYRKTEKQLLPQT